METSSNEIAMNKANAYSRRGAIALMGAVCAGLAMPGRARASAMTKDGIFGSIEVRRTGSARFPKWRGALSRAIRERTALATPCRANALSNCQLHEWQALVDGLRGLDLAGQMHTINLELNRRRYVLDPVNWGVSDYWASPAQFFRKNGDCEDYSFAKYMSLRDLGVPRESMRIVVLHDMNLNIPHAVLGVRFGGDELVLDNQINQVVSHRVIRHYKPIFSINEEAWWIHRKT